MKLLADWGIGGMNVRLFWGETAPEGVDIVLGERRRVPPLPIRSSRR